MLASFVNNSQPTSNEHISVSESCISIYPNPTNDFFVIKGTVGDYSIQILDSNGMLYQNVNGVGSEAVIDISNLPMGLFFVSVRHLSNGDLCVQRIIKGW